MKNINNSFQFQKIIILSQKEKSGTVLNIHPKTLITTKENTIGKSTLLNCLFWGIGCEVRFEEDWKLLDIIVLVEFSVSNVKYQVKRDRDSIYFFDTKGNNWIQYEKIKGEYLDKLNKILNFNILLKNQNSKSLSSVPPAFYFSSTYIEQMNGWNEIWNSFNNLGQFNLKNKREISNYLCGIYDKNYYDNKREKNNFEIDNYNITQYIDESLSVVKYFDKYDSDSISPVDNFKISAKKLNETESILEKKRKEYISSSSRLTSINNEINIILMSIGELNNDYVYSVENIEQTSIHCPTCGVEHHNSLVNRFSIIHDIDKLKLTINSLNEEKFLLERKISNILDQTNHLTEELNSHFYSDNTHQNLNNYILNQTLKPSIQNRVDMFERDKKSNSKLMRTLDRQNKIIKETNLNKVEDDLLTYFNKLCTKLKIKIFQKDNLDEIINYQGGGANQIKAMLAKRLTILKALTEHSEISTPPFVVDSLRQQDVDDNNYEKLLQTLIQETPNSVQLILAAVKNDFTNAIKADFEEIFIEDSLLNKKDYRRASYMIEHGVINSSS
ncbi:hypothetical protein AYL20_07615 [Acinetobacter venetianus]|uniref:hypothetical protein n=1 Tax=Acinetobacter venetianus TaxID=52133 RepID=UPI000775AD35|nr:hypothetical protein [Acinetobacter venetianus]KXO78235.1 hypothetical protein AYL20_07615 [Acinetobacter venetianus]